jgi:NlpC/P60 family putative phage cell wall peptidase
LREKVAAQQPDEREADDRASAANRKAPPLPVGSADHPPPQGGRASREAIVAEARSWIGTPYRHQAALKGVGCDCLGLLVGVWREVMGEASREALRFAISPYTPDWAEALGRETFADGLRGYLDEIDAADAREGDIVIFRWRAHLPAKHAGILTAPDRMVHAQQGAKVAEVAVSGWWRRRMAYGFEIAVRGAAFP